MNNVERWHGADITCSNTNIEMFFSKMIENTFLYKKVVDQLGNGMPWIVVAALHMRESGCNFKTHLHNGDPLNKPTYHVPANRPRGWMQLKPEERTWDRSAVDALRIDGAHKITDWSLANTLEFMERFNGLGYRKRGKPSPYLWAGTDQYVKGKYIRDGVYSETAVDKQLGCCVILLKAKAFPQDESQRPVVIETPNVFIEFERDSNTRLAANFRAKEFQCKCGCKDQKISSELVVKLQKFRELLGKPVRINSGFRCEKHNKAVGGVPGSQHTLATAADIRKPSGVSISHMISLAEQVGFTGIGRYSRFIHVDVRPKKARW